MTPLELERKVRQLDGDIGAMYAMISSVERVQRQQGDRLEELVIDVAGLKGDVAGLKGDVAGLKDDVAGLKGDVVGLKDDVAGLKLGQAELKDQTGEILQILKKG